MIRSLLRKGFSAQKGIVTGVLLAIALSCDFLTSQAKALDQPKLNSNAVKQPVFEAQGFKVYGDIGNKWQSLGAERGLLGAPLSDELPAPHGGRYNRFQRGVIYWHPETGAHFVIGDILQKWVQLGGVEFGYPITDELTTPSGRGRFNHFRAVHLPGKPEASIYWTPSTKAHMVVGSIRQKWAEKGWELGFLGYPTTDEFQDGNGRRSNFEYGFIRWTPQGGAIDQLYSGNFSETMPDGCSAEVSFPPTYGGTPNNPGSVLLVRGPGNITEWSPIFHPGLSDDHQVRWWCHSQTGNFFDIATWNGIAAVNTECQASGGYDVSHVITGSVNASGNCENKLVILPTGRQGWTAERSRCDSRTDFFRARLVPNRGLEIVCIQP